MLSRQRSLPGQDVSPREGRIESIRPGRAKNPANRAKWISISGRFASSANWISNAAPHWFVILRGLLSAEEIGGMSPLNRLWVYLYRVNSGSTILGKRSAEMRLLSLLLLVLVSGRGSIWWHVRNGIIRYITWQILKGGDERSLFALLENIRNWIWLISIYFSTKDLNVWTGKRLKFLLLGKSKEKS